MSLVLCDNLAKAIVSIAFSLLLRSWQLLVVDKVCTDTELKKLVRVIFRWYIKKYINVLFQIGIKPKINQEKIIKYNLSLCTENPC